jgi:hypothetical protein
MLDSRSTTMYSAQGYPRSVSATNRSNIFATLREKAPFQVLTAKIMRGSTRPFLVQHTGLSGSDRHALRRAIEPALVIPASVALDSRRLAGSRRRPSRGAWLFPSLCRGLSRFGRGFNHGWQFPLGLFCSAMMAMVQRLDARGFFFHSQLSVAIFLAFVF